MRQCLTACVGAAAGALDKEPTELARWVLDWSPAHWAAFCKVLALSGSQNPRISKRLNASLKARGHPCKMVEGEGKKKETIIVVILQVIKLL